jgi:hypothetical protein
MNARLWIAVCAVVVMSGCVSTRVTPPGETEELPPEVLALIAPGQDPSSARLEPDGCYWFLHRGPVEDTYIPLLTREQRMICVVAQS